MEPGKWEQWIIRDKGLRKNRQPDAFLTALLNNLDDFFRGSVPVEKNRCQLDGCNPKRFFGRFHMFLSPPWLV
jgi:hypothetical protein